VLLRHWRRSQRTSGFNRLSAIPRLRATSEGLYGEEGGVVSIAYPRFPDFVHHRHWHRSGSW